MRVRPQRPTDRRPIADRRPHVIGTVPPPVAPESDEPSRPVVEHLAERRHRASVAPEDHALYVCQCGEQFQAAVSTSVACPGCGTAQAW